MMQRKSLELKIFLLVSFKHISLSAPSNRPAIISRRAVKSTSKILRKFFPIQATYAVIRPGKFMP